MKILKSFLEIISKQLQNRTNRYLLLNQKPFKENYYKLSSPHNSPVNNTKTFELLQVLVSLINANIVQHVELL